MLPIGPVFRALIRRKFSLGLLVVQISLSLAIYVNLSWILVNLNEIFKAHSNLPETQLVSISLRPTTPTQINYTEATAHIQAIAQLPGVQNAAIVRWIPLRRWAGPGTELRSQPGIDTPAIPIVDCSVSPGWRQTLGLKLITGRDFTAEDMATTSDQFSKTLIITQTLAQALFGKDETALGKTVFFGDNPLEIIGITEDWPGFVLPYPDRVEKTAFLPLYTDVDSEHRYLIRAVTAEQRASVVLAVKNLLNDHFHRKIMLDIALIDVLAREMKSVEYTRNQQLIITMVLLSFVVMFAICAQTIFWTNQRRKHFAIRRALGATQADIWQLILLETGIACSLGILLGTPLAIVINQYLAQANAPWEPASPLLLGGIILAVLASGLISALIPALRASQTPPGLASRSV